MAFMSKSLIDAWKTILADWPPGPVFVVLHTGDDPAGPGPGDDDDWLWNADACRSPQPLYRGPMAVSNPEGKIR